MATVLRGGVHFGIGKDNAYYLGTENIGVASFHDPGDEIGYLCDYTGTTVPQWSHEWSGVERQSSAFDILEALSKNNGLSQEYAQATSPEEFNQIREKYLQDNFRKRLTTLGEIIKLTK